MKFSRELIILSLFSLQFSLCMSNDESCEPMSCLSSQTSIEYPFRIKDFQPRSCGSPGFDVYCDYKLGTPLLELHSAGNFSIDYIYYYMREIYLSDPDNCLPRKLMSLNLTKISPFRPLGQYMDFQVYNCSGNYQRNYSYDQIDCLSGSGHAVISVDSPINDPNCTLLKVVSAPGSFSFSQLNTVSSICLTWDEPNSCKSCGSTAPLLVSGDEDTGHGTPGAGIGLGLGITALLVLIVCYSWRRSRMNHQPPAESPTSTNEVSQQSHSVVPAFTSGLDQRIIDSYPMVVIGESGRLIKPGDETCPICLSEYAPRETLKILPECLHRFHADCIDEWLHTKAICPICRISPSRS